MGKYFIKIGKIRAKIHEIGKIKAIFGLGMTPIYGLKNGQIKSLNIYVTFQSKFDIPPHRDGIKEKSGTSQKIQWDFQISRVGSLDFPDFKVNGSPKKGRLLHKINTESASLDKIFQLISIFPKVIITLKTPRKKMHLKMSSAANNCLALLSPGFQLD